MISDQTLSERHLNFLESENLGVEDVQAMFPISASVSAEDELKLRALSAQCDELLSRFDAVEDLEQSSTIIFLEDSQRIMIVFASSSACNVFFDKFRCNLSWYEDGLTYACKNIVPHTRFIRQGANTALLDLSSFTHSKMADVFLSIFSVNSEDLGGIVRTWGESSTRQLSRLKDKICQEINEEIAN